MGAVRDYYAGKVVLLTGATGLLGKVLVEKLLRDFTHIRRLYVLIRPKTHPNGTVTEPRDRLWHEVLQSSAFDRLRGALGERFTELVEEKVVAVAGDLSQDRLGMDEETYRRLQGEVQLVINCAAMVTFDGPLDTGLSLNTLGPKRVLEFASASRPAIAHVSTCYVNGTRQGEIAEEPLDPQLVISGSNGGQGASYDVDEEVQALSRRIAQIKARPLPLWRRILPRGPGAPETGWTRRAWVEKQLVEEGLRWARSRGWSDTYTFTKAMGEQLLLRYRGDVPVVIVRPAIIEGALEAPEPGWLDGFRMLDPLVVAYGRGSLPDFPGNPQSVLDIVPADVVVNALLAVTPQARAGDDEMVYQVASGVENPITLRQFADLVQEHFQRQSLAGRGGAQRPLPRVTFPKRDRFLRRLRYRFILPLRVVEVLATVLSPLPQGRRLRAQVRSRLAALGRLEYYIRIYGPYAEVSCQYLSRRLRAVWDGLSEDDRALLNFDLSGLDWRHYIQEVYVPGIRRFLLGMTAPQDRAATAERARSDGPTPGVEGVAEAPNGSASPEAGTGLLVEERRSAPGIVAAPSAEVDRWARRTLLKRLVRWSFRFVTGLGYRFYLSLRCEGIENIPTPGPFIVAANHNSHLDTGAILQGLGKRADRVSALAAKDYWFRNKPLSWFADTVLGTAPFDRHSRVADSLGLAVGLLGRGRSLLFFPQGGRSASGEAQPFKGGIGLLALETGVPVVPARVTGTYRALPKGRFLPRRHPVMVRFGPPIYPAGYRHSGAGTDLPEAARRFAADVQRAVEALG